MFTEISSETCSSALSDADTYSIRLTTRPGDDDVDTGVAVLVGSRDEESEVDKEEYREEAEVHVVVLEVG